MICLFSFMMVLGTVGAMENDSMDFNEGTIKAFIFLFIFCISSIKYWDVEDKKRLKRRIRQNFLIKMYLARYRKGE